MFVTLNIQKDGRINIGRCVHWHLDCVGLKAGAASDNIEEIQGPIVLKLPVCKKCSKKSGMARDGLLVSRDGK